MFTGHHFNGFTFLTRTSSVPTKPQSAHNLRALLGGFSDRPEDSIAAGHKLESTRTDLKAPWVFPKAPYLYCKRPCWDSLGYSTLRFSIPGIGWNYPIPNLVKTRAFETKYELAFKCCIVLNTEEGFFSFIK